MYELYDPCTVMFFFRNKHIMIDLGTGNNNKINWPMEDKQVQKYIHKDDKQNYSYVQQDYWLKSVNATSKEPIKIHAKSFEPTNEMNNSLLNFGY